MDQLTHDEQVRAEALKQAVIKVPAATAENTIMNAQKYENYIKTGTGN